MPNHGKRGNGRGGGRGRGRGRGSGRGSIGGGGRGRNRELIPSAIGYVYKPRSNVDDEEDFRVFGQFSSDETDSGNESSPKKQTKKKTPPSAKKNKLGFVRESRPSFGSNYDDHYDESMDHAGLGMSSSSAAASDLNPEERFAKGKSKYFKTVAFTKSSSSIDLSKANEKVIIQKAVVQETVSTEQSNIEESLSKLTMNDFVNSNLGEKEEAKKDLLSLLKVNSRNSSSSTVDLPVEIIDYADIEHKTTIQVSKNTNSIGHAKSVGDIQKNIKIEAAKENNVTTPEDDSDEEEEEEEEDTDDDEEEEDGIDDEEDATDDEEDDSSLEESEEEEEVFFEGIDSDDELLEDDMLVMKGYIENIELEEGEDLNDLLVWSAMQDGNLEIELDSDDDYDENRYDYETLDQEPTGKKLTDFEEEEENLILIEKQKFKSVDESTRKKVSHTTKVDNTIVDPEIFGQTLKAALADVPPGLRPGMRRWYEKQQRKESQLKKKEEAKSHRKEKKKAGKGKGKGKEQDEEDLTNQMAKIDDRIRDFIQDDSITSFQFAPMNTNVRRQLHVLAAAYNLKSKSAGTGGHRSTIVTKTTTTYIPSDRRYISRFLTDIQTNMNEQNRIIGKNRSKGIPLKGKQKFINKKKDNKNNATPKEKRGDSQFPIGPSHGTIVAHNAAPIGETNVGHRMLAAMGWKQGEALGSKSEGIIAPIEAIIRKKGRGLGS